MYALDTICGAIVQPVLVCWGQKLITRAAKKTKYTVGGIDRTTIFIRNVIDGVGKKDLIRFSIFITFM